MKQVKIAITGGPGAGTTTLAHTLSTRITALLEANAPPVITSGSIVRTMAKEHGHTLEYFQKVMKVHKHFDREVDKRIKEILRGSGSFILDSRLGAFFAGRKGLVFSVRLIASPAVAARRIHRDRIANKRPGESLSTDLKTIERELTLRKETEDKRYKKLYSKYQPRYPVYLTIDTDRLTPEQVCEITTRYFLLWYFDHWSILK